MPEYVRQVSTLSKDYSHWRAVKSLSQWLKEQGIPGITGVDTRALTRNLRERGCTLVRRLSRPLCAILKCPQCRHTWL